MNLRAAITAPVNHLKAAPDCGDGLASLNTEGWYIAGGVLAIAAGASLAAFGFGRI